MVDFQPLSGCISPHAQEVKASHTVTAHDFKGLHVLAELTGDRSKRGIVFYSGDKVIPFGKAYYALPISLLWNEK